MRRSYRNPPIGEPGIGAIAVALLALALAAATYFA
jgi:hypothetical protein